MDAYAGACIPPIRGIVVVRHGHIVFERYYDGCTHETVHPLNSTTKSVLSALIGIALRKGLLSGLDQRLADLLPEASSLIGDVRKRAITVRHLLTMTSGLDRQGDATASWDQLIDPGNHDPVRTSLERPLTSQPGTTFAYDDQSVHLLSAVLTRLSGLSASAFARRELFSPLGIWTSEEVRFVWRADRGCHDLFNRRPAWSGDGWPDDGWPWKVDRQGHSLGGGGLHLTLREMAKFGYLYLKGGRWNGTEIVPAWYLRESTTAHSEGGAPAMCPYGYLWWIGRDDHVFAAGAGGQYIHVLPRHDMVIAQATAPPRNSPHVIFGRFIQPAVSE